MRVSVQVLRVHLVVREEETQAEEAEEAEDQQRLVQTPSWALEVLAEREEVDKLGRTAQEMPLAEEVHLLALEEMETQEVLLREERVLAELQLARMEQELIREEEELLETLAREEVCLVREEEEDRETTQVREVREEMARSSSRPSPMLTQTLSYRWFRPSSMEIITWFTRSTTMPTSLQEVPSQQWQEAHLR